MNVVKQQISNRDPGVHKNIQKLQSHWLVFWYFIER